MPPVAKDELLFINVTVTPFETVMFPRLALEVVPLKVVDWLKIVLLFGVHADV